MRLIDADEAVNIINAYDDRGLTLDEVIRVTDGIVREIEAMPTVDAEPVRHGKWIALPKEFDTFCKCSLCNYPVDFNWGQTNYCPNCGAKMDGE